jgi:hypothetical protein
VCYICWACDMHHFMNVPSDTQFLQLDCKHNVTQCLICHLTSMLGNSTSIWTLEGLSSHDMRMGWISGFHLIVEEASSPNLCCIQSVDYKRGLIAISEYAKYWKCHNILSELLDRDPHNIICLNANLELSQINWGMEWSSWTQCENQ